MNAAFDTELFRRELGGWAVRGICCAAVSAFWAVATGFSHPAEIAGMVSGVAFWVTAFAALCAWLPAWAALTGPRTVRALKMAAWLKFALSLAGSLMVFSASFLPLGAAFLMLVGTLDPALGAAALWLAGLVGGFEGIDHICRFDSFGWTALATVFEGALMSLVIGAIAMAVLVWWRIAPKITAWLKLPPAGVAAG